MIQNFWGKLACYIMFVPAKNEYSFIKYPRQKSFQNIQILFILSRINLNNIIFCHCRTRTKSPKCQPVQSQHIQTNTNARNNKPFQFYPITNPQQYSHKRKPIASRRTSCKKIRAETGGWFWEIQFSSSGFCLKEVAGK